jgi:hypothetical protein
MRPYANAWWAVLARDDGCYGRRANDETLLIVRIETAEGVAAAEEMAGAQWARLNNPSRARPVPVRPHRGAPFHAEAGLERRAPLGSH